MIHRIIHQIWRELFLYFVLKPDSSLNVYVHTFFEAIYHVILSLWYPSRKFLKEHHDLFCVKYLHFPIIFSRRHIVKVLFNFGLYACSDKCVQVKMTFKINIWGVSKESFICFKLNIQSRIIKALILLQKISKYFSRLPNHFLVSSVRHLN